MNKQMKHSPEPWFTWSYEGQNETGDHLHSVCRGNEIGERFWETDDQHQCLGEVRGKTEAEAKANAERIVACVNACKGIEDPEREIPGLIALAQAYINKCTNEQEEETKKT